MTPEEQLVHLRDEDAWNLRPLTNRRPVVERRPQRLFAQLGVSVVAGLAIAAVVVFAVGATRGPAHHDPAVPLPVPSLTPEPSRSPTPSPTSTPFEVVPSGTAWHSPPVQAFGGDCSKLLTTSEVRSLIGDGKIVDSSTSSDRGSSDDFTRVWPVYAVTPHNGGLSCGWRNDTIGDNDDFPTITLVVLPVAVAPQASGNATCLVDRDENCTFTVAAHGYLLEASIRMPLAGAYERLDELFATKTAKLGTPPPTWTQRPGDWPGDVDCAALGKAAIPPVATGGWGATTADPGQFGLDLVQGKGARRCLFGDSFGVSYLAGGGWVEPLLTAMYPDAERVTIAGADRAYKVVQQLDGPATMYFVFAHDNLLLLNDGWERGQPSLAYAPALIRELTKLG